jgi:fructose-bisphosphate aldolase class 1
MNTKELIAAAKALVADNKCLLAMDESYPTCNKRFARPEIQEKQKVLFHRVKCNFAARRGEFNVTNER